MTYRLGETHLKAPAMHDSTLSSAQRMELQEGRGEHHLLARMCSKGHASYKQQTQRSKKCHRLQRGKKIDCLDFCLHSKWRKIKAHQCITAHGRSTARAANPFTTTLITCKLQGHQCWEGLGLISCLLLTKVMLTAPFVGWQCRDHRLNDSWEFGQNKRFLLCLKTRMAWLVLLPCPFTDKWTTTFRVCIVS